MRLVIARRQVDYAGRLTAHLPMAVRLLPVKADGSVSVHSDDPAYTPFHPRPRHLSAFAGRARDAFRGAPGHWFTRRWAR